MDRLIFSDECVLRGVPDGDGLFTIIWEMVIYCIFARQSSNGTTHFGMFSTSHFHSLETRVIRSLTKHCASLTKP
ncbi:hypothetical protein Barb4_01812 [Bacteroidales bacterium Barb4]|nr:hypothetical protein Barb4_01812 [Bacteroidales bacterium Barb4]